MAQKNKTARPAARKQQHSKAKKTVAKSSRSRREPIAQLVDRSHPRPAVEPPKLKGELPIPTATFYF
jgi:hypothetical protein